MLEDARRFAREVERRLLAEPERRMYSQCFWRRIVWWMWIVPMFDDSTRICSTVINSSGCWCESVIRSSANSRHGTTNVLSGVTVPWLSAAAIVITLATEPGS